MTRFHYPMSIPEHYSPEQVVAILELLEVLHETIRDVYALQLHELAQLSEKTDDRKSDENIPF
jgi:hypothetical protein